MPSLKQTVTKGFEGMGLTLGEDRGALVVSGVQGSDLKAQVFVDENERLIRVETLLCHPIDELTPELSLALHYLNGHRSGVGYAYRESNRALVARSAWTSPSRDPSDNQLHLLVALLERALTRDAPKLRQVAEGDAGWDAVAEGDAPTPASSPRPPTRTTVRSAMPTVRMGEHPPEDDTSPEPATRAWPGGAGSVGIKGGGDTTRWAAMMDVANEAADATWRRDAAAGMGTGPVRRSTGATRREEIGGGANDPPSRRPGDPPSRPGGEPSSKRGTTGERPFAEDPDEPKKLSRQALAMAISQSERAGDAPKVDLATRRGGGFIRLVKTLFVLAVVGGVVAIALQYFILPFYPHLFSDISSAFETAVVGEQELKRQARENKAGEELLLIELQDPLTDPAQHEASLQRAFAGLGPNLVTALENTVARQPAANVRKAAYELWLEKADIAGDKGLRLRLLKQVVASLPPSATGEDPIEAALLTGLSQNAPPDAQLIEALEWAGGGTWLAVVKLLGRPGEGAQARAVALTKQLPKDTPAFPVLEALVRTNLGPPDGARRLVEGLGARWAQDDGKALILQLVKAQPEALENLLDSQNEDVRAVTVELLTEAGGPTAVEMLIKVMRSDAPVRVRQKAVIGLGQLAAPSSTWPLVQELKRVPQDAPVVDEVKRALKKILPQEAAAQLKEHLADACPYAERETAISALQELHNPAAISVLVERGIKDKDEGLRIRSFTILLEQQAEAKGPVSKGLSVYLDLSKRDPSPKVRELAKRLYDSSLR